MKVSRIDADGNLSLGTGDKYKQMIIATTVGFIANSLASGMFERVIKSRLGQGR